MEIMMKWNYRPILFLLSFGSIYEFCICESFDNVNTITDVLSQEKPESLLLFVTLDGVLTAVEQQTGTVKWESKDNPIVQVPIDITNAIVPIFLPDPRDGSLYLLGDIKNPMKKLPFSIPQLVSSSPCRSSDGILYMGHKKDSWYKLDPTSGNKEQISGWDDQSPTCPVNPQTSVFIGRTRYDIKMVDSKMPENTWNVTFYDYATMSMSKTDLEDYELEHFSSSSSGKVITLNRRTGRLLWHADLKSPVIRMYLLNQDGLTSVPFISMANYTISNLLSQILTNNRFLSNLSHMKLYPTIYIGEHVCGLYATPSLVDQNVVTLTAAYKSPLLLEGPQTQNSSIMYYEYPLPGHNYYLPKDVLYEHNPSFESLLFAGKHTFIGHYSNPQTSETVKEIKLITDESASNKNIDFNSKRNFFGEKHHYSGTEAILKQNLTNRLSNGTSNIEAKGVYFGNIRTWINQQENKLLKLALVVLTGCIIAMFWYLQIQVRKEYRLTKSRLLQGEDMNLSEELPNGMVRVGKICFNTKQLLGKGCEGTFVYKGEFDNRQVAVKRLLPECFTFADREVSLLRESDAHPHVVRYYCTEQDRMFRYIALELCQATLSDYIQGNCETINIKPLEILRQATLGLSHLHSLDIVHRDIKPHNVLLSVPDHKGEVRAKISDFGLCKKLQLGKMSFSKRSGVTGTDGWIAPEMLNNNERTTHAVDLFSLGCLYYYVLSDGCHPFGDTLRRQVNILKGEYDLSKLKGEEWAINIQMPLLSSLISSSPEHRPSCGAVLKHPMFWNYTKILSFFQDVSDRLEKAVPGDDILNILESNDNQVVKSNWKRHIDEHVAADLGKYRSYDGESVRDLLRALRNKKHHFRELSEEVQASLGELPDAFTQYWIRRFPLLLAHTWMTMQCVAKEKEFWNYYHETYCYLVECSKVDVYQEYLVVNAVEHKKKCEQIKNSCNKESDKSIFSEQIVTLKEKFCNGNMKNRPKKKKKNVDEPLAWSIVDL